MDMELVRAAAAAYRREASDSDASRLDFFEGLLGVQQERADAVARTCGYDSLDSQEACDLYRADEPVFSQRPVRIEVGEFARTCARIAGYLADRAGVSFQAAAALRAFDWSAFAEGADLALAGSDPSSFMEGLLADVDTLNIPWDLPVNLLSLVLLFSLRAHLQGPAEDVVDLYRTRSALDGDRIHPRTFVDCPVCGSPASASWVGDTGATDGRGRMQYCSLCGAQWDFERIRCSSCGTRNEGKLHYVNIEGDRAHRILKCEGCGGYQRVLFQDDMIAAPLVMEIEDVVMAKLDQVALSPRE